MPDQSYVTVAVGDGTEMHAFFLHPDEQRTPGLLLFHEAFGVNEHIRDLAARFANQGYAVIAPDLFHRSAPGFEGRYDDMPTAMTHVQRLTVDGMSADIAATFSWMVDNARVAQQRIAAVGYCLGGRAAYLANALLPLAASVSYYGGGIAEGLLDRAPRLHGPQLFFWGGRDRRITPDHHRAITDALRAAGKVFVNVEFSDAQHGYFNDQRSAYNAAAAQQSWPLTLAFLRDYLGESNVVQS